MKKRQPLMVSTLGRTGSSWFMWLLYQHAGIVTHNIFPYEVKHAAYWLNLFDILSQPSDRFTRAEREKFIANRDAVGPNPYYYKANIESSANSELLAKWYREIGPRSLAKFCLEQIDSIYETLAEIQSDVDSVYFMEKLVPRNIPNLMWKLYSQPKEIFLIRDFRDTICSIGAFNKKRGFPSFGRETTPDEGEWIRTTFGPSVNALLESWRQRGTNAYLVSYEDLMRTPDDVLGGVFDYLGLDRCSETISRVIDDARENEEFADQHQTAPTVADSVGRWRRELEPDIIDLCEEMLGEALQAFGYSTKT